MSVIFILMEWWINKISEIGFQETFKFLSRSAFIPQRKPFGVGWARIKFTAPIFLSFPKLNRPAHLSVRTISLCCKKFFPKTAGRKSDSSRMGRHRTLPRSYGVAPEPSSWKADLSPIKLSQASSVTGLFPIGSISPVICQRKDVPSSTFLNSRADDPRTLYRWLSTKWIPPPWSASSNFLS